MCLAIPMKVISIAGPLADVEEAGVRRQVRVDLVEGVRTGDYVIVHAGVAIERLDAEEAEETLRLFAEMVSAAGQEAAAGMQGHPHPTERPPGQGGNAAPQ